MFRGRLKREPQDGVTVDQRALIDKMLARYSGEFTGTDHFDLIHVRGTFSFLAPVFRELLQNSDDAESSVVEIHFTSTACQRHADQKDTDASTLLDSKFTEVRGRNRSVYVVLTDTSLQDHTLDSQKQRETVPTG